MEPSRRKQDKNKPYDNEENLKIFCKQMLKTRIFRGDYREKRYVQKLNCYRDLVVIDNSENALKCDLEIVNDRIVTHYKNEKLWVGYTNPNLMVDSVGGHCLWTDMKEKPFGSYWFRIKTIKFEPQEVSVKLKILKEQAEPSDGGNNRSPQTFDIVADTLEGLQALKLYPAQVANVVREHTNVKNVVTGFKLLTLLLLSATAFLVNLVSFTGDFAIKFMREFSNLVHVCMPLILGIVDIFSKVVGGFYLLLAMIWKDCVRPPNQHPDNRPLAINYRI